MIKKESFYIIISSLLLLILAASIVPVYEVSEAREGVVIQQILRSENWVLPLRHNCIIPSKPILYHWIGALFAKNDNLPDRLALRLPSIVAASLFLLSYFLFVSRFLTARFSIFSTFMLATSYGFFQLGIDGRVDMLFTFLVCAAIMLWLSSAIEVHQQRLYPRDISEKVYFTISILCAFAILTKGPLGVLLPGMVIFFMAYGLWGLAGAFSVIRFSWFFAVIASGVWYYFAWKQGGDAFLAKHFFFENMNRFAGGQGIAKKPWWFYLQHFWTTILPWSILILTPGFFNKLSIVYQKNSLIIKALCIWIFSIVIFLSLSSGKRSAYLLPVIPPFVLLLTLFIEERFNYISINLSKTKIFVISYFSLIVFVSTYCLALILTNFNFNQDTELTISSVFVSFSNNKILIIPSLLIFGFATKLYLNKYLNTAVRSYLLVALALFNIQLTVFILPYFISIKANTHGMTDLSNLAKSLVPVEETLVAVKTYEDESLDTFFFLFKRNTEIIKPEELDKISNGYYIASVDKINDIQEQVKKIGKTFNQLGIGKKPSDEVGKSFVVFKIT